MTLSITSAFDGGNIRVLDISGHRADLEIVKDQNSDFHQWFYFRLAGAAGEEVELRILNCGGAAYPDGWPSYKARISEDRENWLMADTRYENGVLTISVPPASNTMWVAYFATDSMERHPDLIAYATNPPGVAQRAPGLPPHPPPL